MQIGRFTLEQLSEGQFEFFRDGSINRQPIDAEDDLTEELTSGSSSNLIGINPVYISDKEHHILLDTGLGWGLDTGSEYRDVSNIVTNLEIFGVAPSDITHVILSHLHYDHSAGCSFTRNARTLPTFPNAKYVLQQKEWDAALSRVEENSAYRIDDLYRLYADSYFDMLTGKEELIPGLTLIPTGGHSPGHQIVRIHDGGQVAYFPGDLIPSEAYLNRNRANGSDTDPLQSKKAKTLLLQQALKEEAYMLLYHSVFAKSGKLIKNKDEELVLSDT